ncbi:MAG: hypothetical protein JXR83_10120 [Deltaproteobacteria bacterium]|nr:hypothetical protein [Deltaproteobacteria bacterium]
MALVFGACAGPPSDVLDVYRGQQPAYLPEGLDRVAVDEQRVRWQLVERRVFAQVSDSVDLWVQRAEPDAPFGPPLFTGLVPSCHGRERWIVNRDSGAREGACYLRRFWAQGGALRLELRLGGDWSASVSVPYAEVLADDDGDGLNGATERLFRTRPDLADTDRDGLDDGSDPNPLVPDTPRYTEPELRSARLVGQAVATSKACAAGKPLLVVGRDDQRQAFSDLPCRVLWRPWSPAAIAPVASSQRATAAAGGAPAVDMLTREQAAREGGLARLVVEVDESDPRRPVVVFYHLLGVERVVFARDNDRFAPVSRSFELRGQGGAR